MLDVSGDAFPASQAGSELGTRLIAFSGMLAGGSLLHAPLASHNLQSTTTARSQRCFGSARVFSSCRTVLCPSALAGADC